MVSVSRASANAAISDGLNVSAICSANSLYRRPLPRRTDDNALTYSLRCEYGATATLTEGAKSFVMRSAIFSRLSVRD